MSDERQFYCDDAHPEFLVCTVVQSEIFLKLSLRPFFCCHGRCRISQADRLAVRGAQRKELTASGVISWQCARMSDAGHRGGALSSVLATNSQNSQNSHNSHG